MIGLIKSRVVRCVWEKNQYVGVALQPSYESAAEVSSREREAEGSTRLEAWPAGRCGLQSPAGLSARRTTGLDKHPEGFRSMDRVGSCATSSPECVAVRKP